MDGTGYDRAHPTPDPSQAIAVVGAACRLPGAPDLPAFAALLAEGRDAVTAIPEERWTQAAFLNPERGQPGKSYTFAAGVLDAVDRFDPAFFGISPREAAQMDPQQRLLLELAHEAMEDGGLDGSRLAGSRVGVYVGGSAWDYTTLNTGDPSVTDAYSMTGSTLCSLANRISYVFDLRGPSFTVDTACSSSLVALHLACEAIRAGQVPAAIVGGVNLLLAPQSFVGFSRAAMLSPRGRCHAFDARADGYVRAEGGGVVLLKPLADALEAGDRVRAVIRGTGVNQDGRTTGFSLPNKAAQAALLREVYARFGLDPNDLIYVEAHGTGTPAGDPIEAGALGEVLGRARAERLPVGSVKTNLGHLEAASGMAGLLKAMLVLERGAVPASLHCATPNPAIPFDALNLSLVPAPLSLGGLAPDAIVSINSFGFGGTNAHAVLGAAPAPAATPNPNAAADDNDEALPPLLLSARSEQALRDLAAFWRGRFARGAGAPAVRAVARAREHHAHRLAVLGADPAGLVDGLDGFLAGRGAASAVAGTALLGRPLAFVFSGNGSQWAGMGADATRHSPTFRAALARIDAALLPHLGWSVRDRLARADDALLGDTSTAQPLLFAVQAALVEALAAVGVVASAYLGHSVGEVAAAWASGALTLDQAARVIAVRSRHQQSTRGAGGMGVLALPHGGAAEVATAVGGGLEVAAINSDGSATIAGPKAALADLAALAAGRGWAFTRLDLDYAFHSAAMDPIEAPLLADLAGLAPSVARAPFLSSVTGGELQGPELGARYWWRNVREPVRFSAAVDAAIADGARIFLEIGPHPVLQAYLHDALRRADAPGRVLPTLSRRPAAHDPVRLIAARCHVSGHGIAASPLFDGPADVSALPAYPWQRERYWVERTTEATDTLAAPVDHPLLGQRRGAEPDAWTRHVGLAADPWLADHVVGGAVVLPAAAILDMAWAAARARHPDAPALEARDVEIARALVLDREGMREQRARVRSDAGRWELSSRARLRDEPWTEHAAAAVGPADQPGAVRPAPALPALTGRLDAVALYAAAARLGLDYGPAFRTVSAVALHGPTDAVVALAPGIPGVGAPDGTLINPALLDGAMQGLVALAAPSLAASEGTGVVPWRFGRARLLRPEGAVPVAARLHLSRIGPRAVCADITLLDATGTAVAELLDCWFVSVRLGRNVDHAARCVRMVQVAADGVPGNTQANALSDIASNLAAGAALPAGNPVWAEAGMLADAFATACAHAALRGTEDPDGPIRPDALGNAGAPVPLLRGLLGWMDADGLAARDGDAWRLADAELPPPDDIFRSLLFDAPEAVADATLLAGAAEALPAVLAGAPSFALPAALRDHLLHASPSADQAAATLANAVLAAVRAWPAGCPLRVLELGAGRGALTRRVLRRLESAGAGAEVHLVAATSADDLPALTEALSPYPEARAIGWQPGDAAPPGRFDLVIGLHALSRLPPGDAGALATLPDLLAPGGLLLTAEPAPNRAWELISAADPAALPATRDGAAWRAALAGAGLDAAWSRELPEALWPVCLVGGRAPLAVAAPAPARSGVVHVFAEPDDALAGTLADALREAGLAATVAGPDSLAAALARPGVTEAVVLAPDGDSLDGAAPDLAAAWLAHLAALAGIDAEARVWVVTRGDAAGEPFAAALLGLGRVLANEAPALGLRQVRLARGLPDAAARLARVVLDDQPEPEQALHAGGRTVTRARAGLPRAARPATGEVRLAAAQPGLLGALRWEAAPAPAPGPDEIAVRVEAAALNFRDVMWAMGLLPDEALLDGFAGPTLGLECAGVVDAVGEGVTGFAPGDRVMAFAPASLATRAVTRAHAAVRLPDGLSFAQAATIPVAFLTAAYALGHLARVQPGESVLIHGGAGGVGLAAIQYAKGLGATVFATAGSASKRALLRRLGVDAALDSRSLRFADEVMRLTGGQGVDVVLNSLSGEAMERSLAVLRPFGRFLELGKRDFYGNTPVGLRPFRRNVAYHGVDVDALPVQRPELAASLLAEVSGLFAEGRLRPLPHRVFEFDDAVEAFRLMQSAGHVGKIVLVPGARPPRAAEAPAWTARGDHTYVVTGGPAGFALEAARWLAASGVRHVVFLSRRGAAAPGAEDALASLGVQARALACDVADEAALAATLDRVRADMPPIGGVVHAAMVLDDALLTRLDAARFARVLVPKWGGAEALDRLTRADPVELFLLFSSVTAAFGNPGQGNYVAANAALEAVAERRHREGLPALAVGWGPIGDAGYLTRAAAVGDALAKRLGTAHLRAADALAALPALLASGAASVAYADLRWAALRGSLPLVASPMFAGLAAGAAEDAAEVDLRALVEGRTPEEARTLVAGLLVQEVASILKLAPDRVDPARPLAELGMDSLMAVELRLAMERRFGVTLPVLALSEGTTLDSMARRVVGTLQAGTPNAATDANDVKAGDAAALLARYEPGAVPDLPGVPAEIAAAPAMMSTP